MQEKLRDKNALHKYEKIFMLELHPKFSSELNNSDLLLAKVSRLQVWTLEMLDNKANMCFEQQPLHQDPGEKAFAASEREAWLQELRVLLFWSSTEEHGEGDINRDSEASRT